MGISGLKWVKFLTVGGFSLAGGLVGAAVADTLPIPAVALETSEPEELPENSETEESEE